MAARANEHADLRLQNGATPSSTKGMSSRVDVSGDRSRSAKKKGDGIQITKAQLIAALLLALAAVAVAVLGHVRDHEQRDEPPERPRQGGIGGANETRSHQPAP
ncbi:hypothetical protein M3Y99_01832900 [Aphelenchoides fujianensis]|nr:hypothetical protein M3Y99_01832900 [Aphelenchoides fujianensis]